MHTDCPCEACPPPNWIAYWYNEYDDICNESHVTGQPEIKMAVDPGRVWSGVQALQWFTFYRCHQAGVFQKMALDSGIYQVKARYHSYYSSCDSQPHATWPKDNNCIDIPDPYWQMYVNIGLDPSCDINPRSSAIQWSQNFHCHGEYCEIESPPVMVKNCATVYIQTTAIAPLKHNDAFIDHITLEKLQ